MEICQSGEGGVVVVMSTLALTKALFCLPNITSEGAVGVNVN